jgi:hypothetical protein
MRNARWLKRVTSVSAITEVYWCANSFGRGCTLNQTLDFSLYLNMLAYLSEHTLPCHHSWILSISTPNNASQDVNNGLQRRFRRRDSG